MSRVVSKMIRPIAVLLIPATTFVAWLLTSSPAEAATTSLKKLGANMGYSTADNPKSLGETIGGMVGTALALLGIIFTILVIYAGFLWMTAQGNEEQVKKARNIITNSVIGIIITALAYTISSFVFAALPK
jgi:hypothetical protein